MLRLIDCLKTSEVVVSRRASSHWRCLLDAHKGAQITQGLSGIQSQTLVQFHNYAAVRSMATPLPHLSITADSPDVWWHYLHSWVERGIMSRKRPELHTFEAMDRLSITSSHIPWIKQNGHLIVIRSCPIKRLNDPTQFGSKRSKHQSPVVQKGE